MFTKFNNKFNTIFLDTSSPSFEVSDKVNVILSPSLYWVKKLSLPVKYERDAKKLLPSVFEDILPHGNYSYSVYKSGNDFFAFAYEDKKILDTLSKKGISASNIANVYFAQSELTSINGALKISETQSVYMKDDILILVPCCWIEESSSLNVREITLSNHSIALKQFGHIVDEKSIYNIGAILLVLIMLISVQYMITTQKIAGIRYEIDDIFTKNNLKSTMFQNKAMLKNYAATHERQTKIREYISVLLSSKLKSSEKLSLLSLKNNILEADFSDLSEATQKEISEKLQLNKVKFKSSMSKDNWHVEITL